MFLYSLSVIKVTLVKRKIHISRTSIADMVDLMMAQTGINREQAVIALDTIVHYMKKHPFDPFNKLVGYLFGNDRDPDKGSLN
jgi:hypothetical protein